MISRVHSSILQGIDAIGCEVEADVSGGREGDLKLVGTTDNTVQESTSRIQAALRNSGYRWPGPKVTINLAPADARGQESTKRALTVAAARHRNTVMIGPPGSGKTEHRGPLEERRPSA